MSIKKAALLLVFMTTSLFVFAQKTSIYSEANLAYKRGMDFYEQRIYPLAQQEFVKVIETLREVNDPEYRLLSTQAELHFAKSAVRMGRPDGEKLILDFARTHDPDPLANQAMLEMAEYYFNQKDYAKAIELYQGIDLYDLPRSERSEVSFRIGYSNFVKKKFNNARPHFQAAANGEDNKYIYPSNYYLGLCDFYNNKYEAAVRSFKKVEKSKKYAPHIPYYIATIYFSQGQYDKVIEYVEKKLKLKGLKKQAELNQLIGQAYFEMGEFENAQPYLEYFAENSSRLRPEDLYQLGFVQHGAGQYKKASKNLEQLSKVDSEMGQNAMYTLADCYLKMNDKAAARNAFKTASKMNYDSEVQGEAIYNYAKLSYELNFNKEAIASLQEINRDSKYYSEAQSILSGLFLSSRDYESALKALEEIPNKTPKLKETYQKVAYYRGLQLIRDGNFTEGKQMLRTSLENPLETRTKALSLFWLGELAHREKKYNGSINELNKFLALSKTLNNLPDEASSYAANYTQGYNYLKQKNYNSALGYYENCVAGIKKDAAFIENDYIREVMLGDATLRAGDCLFKQNNYKKAISYYNDAIQNEYEGFEYAMFQKAIIEGLRGKTTNKIIALEDLIERHPNSEYADDALLQLGATYLEIGKLNEASTELKKLTVNYPKSTLYNQALLRLGLITYNQGNLPGAIEYYKQVFYHNPEAEEAQAAYSALEEIYIEDLGKAEEFVAFIESIPNLEVQDDEKENLNFKAADAQYSSGNYQQAVQAFTTYINKYPNGRNNILAHFRRAESYFMLKQYAKSVADYEFVSKKGPSKYYEKSLRKSALIAYNYEEDFAKSYKIYTQWEQAAQNDTDRFEAQLGAMRSAYRINNMQSVAIYAQKVAGNAQASGEQKAVANFYIGKIAYDKEDFDAALPALNEVTKNTDDETAAEARYLIAHIYYLRRDLDIAQQLCMNANQESSEYPYWVAKSVILLADVLAEKGDLFNAQAALEGLIEFYEEDQELIDIAKAKLKKLQDQEAAGSRLINEPPGGAENLDLEEDPGDN